ncbi:MULTISPECIES: potassium/proton antiporter [unclassified Psychrobacter]|uniref:potassium/proton antiporter n=1 Tax=unclassified Psychrobacter TaxID=196806 RepID=UPI00086A3CDB|nr:MULTISPECIES: potassium/proton antiporter [unclassified Psychrobacter]OEH66941.1 MAG: K+/H+ antiporter [Psychrobacter sp. B29-1]PKG65380.1 potassium/proton antiporter [Psychrobacter sp. Choline-02u-13]PKH55146.1 potassium/proton antiporter [Psychrobacter sp. Choline-02u-9]TEW88077.1 potassium/proton antiporter [Psychrobacter sp. 230]|tara:strand:- start:45762 stop:47552 length:1791 start_codon:yes stop_codon:yes gene_type:complete
MDTLNILYLVGAVLIFASIMASTLSARLGVPLLLLFLIVGMLAGEQGILGIEFSQYALANFVGQAALACILLDGGLRTSFKSFRVGLKPAITLATWGVLVTVMVLGVFVTWLLDVDWRFGLLMAAIVGSTDAAAVFSLLRNGGVKLNDRVQATLELESGANDPLAILLVTGLIALNVDPDGQTVFGFLVLLLQQLSFGLGMGLLFGYFLSRLLPKVHLAEGMYAILILSAGLAVFAATNLIGGSGFLAVYLTGVLIGNHKVRSTEHVMRVMDSFAWLSQAVLFVVLGLLVTPSNVLNVWHYSVAIALFMIFVARPIAVYTSVKPFKFKDREIGFISWVGLRGAVPITLAILPVMAGIDNAFMLFDIAFGVVVLSLVLQGTTIPTMANLFKVRIPTNKDPKEEHEVWVSDKASITLYEFEAKSGAFAIGRHPMGISKGINPDEISVFALVRNQQIVVVDDNTKLKFGDSVWYAMRGNHASKIAKIFNDTTLDRKAIDDFYGDWLLSPSVKLGDLPFFTGIMASETLVKTLKTSDEDSAKNMWEQTVAEYVKTHLGTAPVSGDTVVVSDEWSLVIKEVGDKGKLRTIGLKYQQPSAIV